MRESFITSDEFGPLFIIDPIVVYDYPLIFVCEDDFGTKYLFSEMQSDDEMESWCAIKMKKGLYQDLVTDRISIQDAYRKNKQSPFFIIKHVFSSNAIHIEKTDTLPDDAVTEEKSFVSSFREAKLETFDSLKSLSTENQSCIVEYVLYASEQTTSIDYELHNGICDGTVKTIKALFPEDCLLKTEIILPEAGSYPIRIGVRCEQQDFLRNPAKDSVCELQKMLSFDFSDVFESHKNNEKLLKAYSDLVDQISKVKSAITVNTAVPYEEEIKTVLLDHEMIEQYKDSIEKYRKSQIAKESITSEIDITGSLLCYNLVNRRFIIIDKDNASFSGDLSDSLNEDKVVGLGTRYKAHLIYSKQDGASPKYTLISLQMEEN